MGNWDFDGDEAIFFFVAGIIGVVGLFRWYIRIIRRARLARCGEMRLLLAQLLGLDLILFT